MPLPRPRLRPPARLGVARETPFPLLRQPAMEITAVVEDDGGEVSAHVTPLRPSDSPELVADREVRPSLTGGP